MTVEEFPERVECEIQFYESGTHWYTKKVGFPEATVTLRVMLVGWVRYSQRV